GFHSGSFLDLWTAGAGDDFHGGLRFGGSQTALWGVGGGLHETKSPGGDQVFAVWLRRRREADDRRLGGFWSRRNTHFRPTNGGRRETYSPFANFPHSGCSDLQRAWNQPRIPVFR